MRVRLIDPIHPDPAAIGEAAVLLQRGGLVAFPTETVYGLGANALDEAAVARIYAAKGRPSHNPVIVHVADAEAAQEVTTRWPDSAAALAARFWPGPLTLVLQKSDAIPDSVTAGLPSVAVRVPAHPVARALLVAARVPVAAPSANRSMMLSPTTGGHVEAAIGAEVDLILDAGQTTVGIESTVLDLSSGTPALLRPGMISIAQLESIVGPVRVFRNSMPGDAPRPSPGMLDRHYAPRARLMLIDRSPAATEATEAIGELRRQGKRVGALLLSRSEIEGQTIVRMPETAAPYAARLYDTLHTLDDAACDVIVVERVPDSPEWDGVRDRLERAAR